METMQDQAFSIAEISVKLKVPKHTLRFWEREFVGTIVPLRTQGGQRRYTSEHVVLIEMIKRLRDRGLSLSQIKRELNNGHGEGQERPNKIDLLATRVAEVVKTEVYNFFIVEENKK
jgi:DNA-binding transcriptional MerR regulator